MNGNNISTTARLKAKVPLKWKMQVKYLLSSKENLKVSKKSLKIIVALAADYGNLGDVAITKAQIALLKDVFPDREIFTIHINEMDRHLIHMKKFINEGDIITIIGGGNMGDLYGLFEEYRRAIIELFPYNKVVSFPQTIDFTQDNEGQNALNKSIKVYSKHPNLHIFAREQKSFEIMQSAFKKNKVYLVPDIVLYLNKAEPTFKRDGILFCLRDDFEKKISKDDKEKLIKLISQEYSNVKYYDTHIGDENYSKELADMELENIWNAFKQAKIVITDRLHGMIFCAITKTPCIVLPNSNHKIAGTYYNWLSELSHIKFFEEYDEKSILNNIDQIYNNDSIQIKTLDLNEKYQCLVNILKN